MDYLGKKRELNDSKENKEKETESIIQPITNIDNKTEEDKFNIDYFISKSSAANSKRERKLLSDSYINISNFEKIAQVGEGTYGKVYKVKRRSLSSLKPQVNAFLNNSNIGQEQVKNDYFALKKLIYDVEKDGFPITAMREIKILQELDHKNIVRLLDIIISKPTKINKYKGNVYLLLEYVEHDLSGLLDNKLYLSQDSIKGIMYQILQGVDFMHSKKGILHRDIKASNILISSTGKVKIADFGLARYFSLKDIKLRKQYTNKVITLWYRPPELFFGEYFYKEAVDIWSLGILFWQLHIGAAPIKGIDDKTQIDKILEIMGTIDEESWPEVRNYKHYLSITADKPKTEGKFYEMTKHFDESARDLLCKLLAYNPKDRISCKEALNHKYFTNDLSFTEKYDQILSSLSTDKQNKLGEGNIDMELHEYSSYNKRKMQSQGSSHQARQLNPIKEAIKPYWINADYYSKRNKLSELNYFTSLLN